MIGSEVEALSNLLKAHGDKVLSGGQRLALTAALVQKVSAAFSLLVTSAGGGDLRDFQVVPASSNTRLNDLHFLHDFLQRVDALLVSHGSSTLRGDVDLAKFRNLIVLELSRVPLHLVSGLAQLQPRLKCVVASRSVDRVENILGQTEWPDLIRLSLPHNTLRTLDNSFSMATSLKEVDLRHNVITDTTGLELLPNLVNLDLSYNRLTYVPRLHKNASKSLKSFAIAHNMLEQLKGLEHLSSLELFHCGWNCLVKSQELVSFSRLPRLKKLWMSGNPLVRTKDYREIISRRLHPCIIPVANDFFLDGANLSEEERRWIGAACIDTIYSSPSTSQIEAESTSPLTQSMSRKSARVREVVISDINEVPAASSSRLNQSFTSTNDSMDTVIETRKQIESLREKLGETWLGGVTNVLGLPEEELPADNIEERFEAQAWLDNTQKPEAPQTPGVSYSEPEEFEKDDEIILQDEVSFVTVECDPFLDDSQCEPSPPNMPIDSGNEHLNDSDDEESGSEITFIAQREIQFSLTNSVVKDYFVIVGSSKIVERETSGKVSAQWPLESLISCERKNATNVFLSFDTIRRDKENREYMLEPSDAYELAHQLNSALEARSLGEMNQAVFRCMRCSAHFSSEISDLNSKVSRCPNCNSAVVVQEDVQNKSFYQPKQPVIAEVQQPRTHQKQSSIGSLLDQSMCDSGLGLIPGQSRPTESNDSDIEVLSNPSQSSIEVIPPSEESHSREESAAPTSSIESRAASIHTNSDSPTSQPVVMNMTP